MVGVHKVFRVDEVTEIHVGNCAMRSWPYFFFKHTLLVSLLSFLFVTLKQ